MTAPVIPGDTKSEGDEMGRICSMPGGGDKCIQRVVENLKGTLPLRRLR